MFLLQTQMFYVNVTFVESNILKMNAFKGSNRPRKLRLEICSKNNVQSLDLDKTERGS